MRTFIAIDIPEKIKEEIVKIQNSLPEFKGKKTEFENLHLTLKFLGEVNEKQLELIKERLRKIKLNSFEAEINSIGIFSDRIVWIGIKNCEKLQKEIDEKLSDLFEMEKRFMGHLTIARIKNLKERKIFLEKVKKIKIPEMKFVVKNFNLKKSKLGRPRPIYEDIEVYNLKI
jgi:2'-5' RNA ligase